MKTTKQTLIYLNNTSHPFDILKDWYKDIAQLNLIEPEAATLITSNRNGKPSGRTVLLKKISKSGLVFYTNYQSRKAKEIQENPQVALLIYFDSLERQIRIEGSAEKLSPEGSDAYFASRSYGNQIGAWASYQSQEISHRKQLEDQFQAMQKKYPQKVPRPPYWGGFLIKPNHFEFWVAEQYRLHHRFVFVLDQKDDNKWQKKILYP